MFIRFTNRIVALALITTATARGDILIESIDAAGRTGRVVIAGDKARIDTPDAEIHMLLDLAARKVYAVNDREHFAMDLGSPRPQRSEHSQLATTSIAAPKVRMDAVGDGPVIAGFATRRYRVTVNEVHCYDEFLASDPLQQPLIRLFLEVMAAASENLEQRTLTLLTEPERVCEVTDDLVDDHYPALGIPMRTVDPGGAVNHEITRIHTDAPHTPGLAELPADYPVLTRAQVMERGSDQDQDLKTLLDRQQRIQQRMDEIEQRGAPVGEDR